MYECLWSAQYGKHRFPRNVCEIRKISSTCIQILLGGGILGDGQGRISDKVIKIPSKRGPESLRLILDDFIANGKGKLY